jgi:hypothetical protein
MFCLWLLPYVKKKIPAAQIYTLIGVHSLILYPHSDSLPVLIRESFLLSKIHSFVGAHITISLVSGRASILQLFPFSCDSSFLPTGIFPLPYKHTSAFFAKIFLW